MALRRQKVRGDLAEVPPRRIPAALAGATGMVDLGSGSSWATWKFSNKDWQAEAWRLYDIVPELAKLAGRIGDSVSQARLYVTEVDETGEETGEVTDQSIRRLAAVPLGTGAQRDDCLKLAGTDLAVGGECYIVGEGAARNPEKAEGNWFVVTGSAFKRQGDDLTVKRPKIRGGRELALRDGVDILIRCWNPHPNDVDQANSFSRPGIVPLREIELLTKREFAELDSRLTGAGILFLPEGLSFPKDPQDEELDDLTGFMAYLQRAAAASMSDQSTARAMVPIMATVPDGTDLSSLKDGWINFWSELSAEIGPMKERAITRLASTAEIPAEVLTGIGDANHWTAWLISDEGIRWIKGYLGPIADALTRGFLHLALASMGVPNPERYAFAFDTSSLAAKPNRLDEALQLHDRQLIADEEVVKAGAFSVEQMPDDAARVKQLLWVVVKNQPDLLADPAIQAALGLPEITAASSAQPAIEQGEGDEGGPAEGPPNGGDPEEPDDEGDAGDAAAASRISAALDHRIAMAALPSGPPSPEAVFNAACKLLVYRALELAGGRLATPQERRGRWADVPRHELHHWVGPITAEKAARVTAGAWNHVGVAAADLGVDPVQLEHVLSTYVTELLMRGLRHHDDMLFATLAMPNQGRGLVAA